MPNAIARSLALYKRASDAFKLNEIKLPPWSIALLAAAAYGLGVLVRLGVAERSARRIGVGPDGEKMFATTDAYYYATGVVRELSGVLAGYDRVPTMADNALVALGTVIVQLTGESVSKIGSAMPTYVAPLLAVAVVVWGLALRMPRIGVLAAFPVAIGYSYLNRTSPGQFDTDLLSVTWPHLALGLAMLGLSKESRPAIVSAAAMCALSGWVHPGSERVLALSALVVAGYVVVFRRDRLGVLLVMALFVSLAPVAVWLRLSLVAASLGLERVQKLPLRAFAGLAGVAGGVLLWKLASLDYNIVLGGLGGGETSSEAVSRVTGYEFYNVRHEVTELRDQPLDRLIERMTGNRWLLVISVLGCVLLVFAEPLALPLAPLVLLGTVGAVTSGLRFTAYAPPGLSLGAAYLLCGLVDIARVSFPRRDRVLYAVGGLLVLVTVTVPAVTYGRGVHKASAFSPNDARLLGKLAGAAKDNDFVFGWWDYGYPIWYYAHARSLVDGAKQDADLFLVAEVLFGDSQLRSAQLARLSVETYRDNANGLQPAVRKVFQRGEQDGFDGDAFLARLAEPAYPLPEPRGDIYLYLPWRTAGIATMWARARQVQGLASREELDTGYVRSGYAPRGVQGRIKLTAGNVLDAERFRVFTHAGRKSVASVITVRYERDGQVRLSGEVKDPQGTMHVLHLPQRRSVVVVDEIMLRSVYVELAILGKVDRRAFEPVAFSAIGAIYRVVP